MMRALGAALVLLLASCATPLVTRAPFDPLTHRLVPGDMLDINIDNDVEVSGMYAINGEGVLGLPLIGDVEIACAAIDEAPRLILRAITRNSAFVRDPLIGAQIAHYAPYEVSGAVNTPGAYDFTSGLSATDAIAAAGGFAPHADRAVVRIKRPCERGERLYRLDPATPILPGDRLRVGKAW